jgi:AcrR family transcriptional regulator
METRDMILETAFISFLDNGFKGVSLNEIIKKTTMTKGAFYHYFNSKEMLISEVINKYFNNFIIDNIKSFSSIEGSTIEKINHAVLAISTVEERVKKISPSILNIRDYLMLLQQALQIDEVLRQSYLQSIEKAKLALIHILKEGQGNKEIRTDILAEEMAEMVNVIIKGSTFESSMLTNEAVDVALNRNMRTLLKLFKTS